MRAKRLCFLVLVLLFPAVIACASANWKYVEEDTKADACMYIDRENAWYAGKEGGDNIKITSTRTGYSILAIMKFKDDDEGNYDVTLSHGQAYGPNGTLLYMLNGSRSMKAEEGSLLKKTCQAVIELSKKNKKAEGDE